MRVNTGLMFERDGTDPQTLCRRRVAPWEERLPVPAVGAFSFSMLKF